MTWNVITTHELTTGLLQSLFENKIAAIRVPGFIDTEICKKAVTKIKGHGIDYYENVKPKIGRIGITQFEHGNAKKTSYLAKAPENNARREQIFSDQPDLLYEVVNNVRKAWGPDVGIAMEEGSQQYFAGLIRVIDRALLHLDWAKLDGSEWKIGQVSGQIAWNIYLQMGEEGGATNVYCQQWQEHHQLLKNPHNYDYDRSIVQDCEMVKILPKQGELVLFNSRNFHEVESTSGDVERITISSFIGQINNSAKLVFWS